MKDAHLKFWLGLLALSVVAQGYSITLLADRVKRLEERLGIEAAAKPPSSPVGVRWLVAGQMPNLRAASLLDADDGGVGKKIVRRWSADSKIAGLDIASRNSRLDLLSADANQLASAEPLGRAIAAVKSDLHLGIVSQQPRRPIAAPPYWPVALYRAGIALELALAEPEHLWERLSWAGYWCWVGAKDWWARLWGNGWVEV